MNNPYACQDICRIQKLTDEDIALLRRFMDNKYKTQWTLNNLPANNAMDDSIHIVKGVPIGEIVMNPENGRYEYSLNNHLTFKIGFRNKSTATSLPGYEIVSFHIKPLSIANQSQISEASSSQQVCDGESSGSTITRFILPDPKEVPSSGNGFEISYSYSVEFIDKSETGEDDNYRWKDMVEASNEEDEEVHDLGIQIGLFILAYPVLILFLMYLGIKYPGFFRRCVCSCNKKCFGEFRCLIYSVL